MVGPESAVWQTSSSTASPDAEEFLYGGRSGCHPAGAPPSGCADICPGFCRILNPAYRKSHLAAPLRIGENTIGALCVGGASPGLFRPEAARVLAQLAGIAAVALENSRLYQQAEQVAALKERQRIASDMHDGLLQTLNFLRWMVNMSADQLARGDAAKTLETFRQVERAEEQAEGEIRQAIASLQEDFPTPNSLQEQLAALVEERSANGPAVEWECSVNSPVIISRQESEQVLRVAREALLNAQNHSQARRISLCFQKSNSPMPGEEYQLSVIDDGIGFSIRSEIGDGRPHFGLKIMRARAARIKGQISIDSRPGQGTCLVLSWPVSLRTNGQKAGGV
jgi:signal transduction histidine kinase